MPDEPEESNLAELSETEDEEPERYTKEWYDSVEQRFQDLGDYIKQRGSGTRARKQTAATPPTSPTEGEPSPSEETDGTVSVHSVADTRPPRPNHWWFRSLRE